MKTFLKALSEQYTDDQVLLICDGAPWHKSKTLSVPNNIHLQYIPPYTPEMNPIEQVWREIRTDGFRNEVFITLGKVVDCLCDTICLLTKILLNASLDVNGYLIFLKLV